MVIAKGVVAPDFELASHEANADGKPGKKIRLSEYRGKKTVVLAFYPLDFSPTCTTENCAFRDNFSDFEAADIQILGISVDSVWTHKAYAEKLGLTYPLLADFHPKGAVATLFGLYHPEKGITARATVIVGKDGTVLHAEEHALGTPRVNKNLLAAVRG